MSDNRIYFLDDWEIRYTNSSSAGLFLFFRGKYCVYENDNLISLSYEYTGMFSSVDNSFDETKQIKVRSGELIKLGIPNETFGKKFKDPNNITRYELCNVMNKYNYFRLHPMHLDMVFLPYPYPCAHEKKSLTY